MSAKVRNNDLVALCEHLYVPSEDFARPGKSVKLKPSLACVVILEKNVEASHIDSGVTDHNQRTCSREPKALVK